MSSARTIGLSIVEAEQNAENAANDEEQSKEVEVPYVFPECSAFVRIEIQAKEQDAHSETSTWPVSDVNTWRKRWLMTTILQVDVETPRSKIWSAESHLDRHIYTTHHRQET